MARSGEVQTPASFSKTEVCPPPPTLSFTPIGVWVKLTARLTHLYISVSVVCPQWTVGVGGSWWATTRRTIVMTVTCPLHTTHVAATSGDGWHGALHTCSGYRKLTALSHDPLAYTRSTHSIFYVLGLWKGRVDETFTVQCESRLTTNFPPPAPLNVSRRWLHEWMCGDNDWWELFTRMWRHQTWEIRQGLTACRPPVRSIQFTIFVLFHPLVTWLVGAILGKRNIVEREEQY